MAGITITFKMAEGKCSDGTTPAATLEVAGPEGSFDWGGGEPSLRSLLAFLQHIRMCDRQVASRLSIVGE